jgi:exopolysaccharide biosynthesis polyprenyl glycosylphosphotransferase
MLADFLLPGLTFATVGPLGMLLEFVIHGNSAVLLRPLRPPASDLGWLVLYGALIILLGHSDGLYRPDLMREPKQERIIAAKAVAWATVLVGVAIHQLETRVIPIGVLTAGALLNYLAMLGWRNWRRLVTARRVSKGHCTRNVLIVGSGKLGRKVAAALEQDQTDGRKVVGFLDENGPIVGHVLGRVEDLARIARAEFVDEVILAIPGQPGLSQRVIQEARRCRLDIRAVPEFFGCGPDSLVLENFGNLPVLTLHKETIPALSLVLKRVVDVVLSSAGLVVAAPMLAVIALLVKLDSVGPSLYCAPRVGRKGKRFICYKFRTMVTNADKLKEGLRGRNEREGPFFKIANDPRITRVGKFLRRYSLDELPQLWNVLKGEMSLVGPRPHPLDDFEHYHVEHLRRLHVTPGITGLWQVTARRDPSFQRNMVLDLQYIEHWNLWMDLRILYKTISVVLQGSGA